jgi:hypothetical protein
MNDQPLDYPERPRFVRIPSPDAGNFPAGVTKLSSARTTALADRATKSANSVPPTDPLMLHRIMDRRVNLYQRPIANDRYAPSAWDDDDGITAALERDARGYGMIAMVGSALVLLLGIVAWVALP